MLSMNIITQIKQAIQATGISSERSNNCLNPPVSEDVVLEIELDLGVRLPPIIKMIYTEVGNGGFGPGHGFLPLSRTELLPDGRFVVDCCKRFRELKGWHNSILPLNSWGCGVISCIDVDQPNDPPVYRYEPNIPDDLTVQYLKGCPFRGFGLLPECLNLSEWLNEWVIGNETWLFSRMNAM